MAYYVYLFIGGDRHKPVPINLLVVSAGYDPATSRLSGARSNQLSYETIMVELVGYDPTTSTLQVWCSPD